MFWYKRITGIRDVVAIIRRKVLLIVHNSSKSTVDVEHRAVDVLDGKTCVRLITNN